MTDLEITRLCAESIGSYFIGEWSKATPPQFSSSLAVQYSAADKFINYDPLHDDAQAMALVKKFGVEIHCRRDRNGWYASIVEGKGMTPHADLNRAICECVAKMQEAKREG